MSLTTEDKETLRAEIDALLSGVLDEGPQQIRIDVHGNHCIIEHVNKHKRSSGITFCLTKEYESCILLSELDNILNPRLFQQKSFLNPKLSHL